ANQAEPVRPVMTAEAYDPAALVGVAVAALEEGPVIERGGRLHRDPLDPEEEPAVKGAVHRREGLGLADEVLAAVHRRYVQRLRATGGVLAGQHQAVVVARPDLRVGGRALLAFEAL